MNRRMFVTGIAGILAAGVAPRIIACPMKLWVPPQEIIPGWLIQPLVQVDPATPVKVMGRNKDRRWTMLDGLARPSGNGLWVETAEDRFWAAETQYLSAKLLDLDHGVILGGPDLKWDL